MQMTEHSDDDEIGLDPEQAAFLDHVVINAIKHCTRNNPHDFHYGLFVMLRGQDNDGWTITATDMISSLPKETMHEILRAWMNKETH